MCCLPRVLTQCTSALSEDFDGRNQAVDFERLCHVNIGAGRGGFSSFRGIRRERQIRDAAFPVGAASDSLFIELLEPAGRHLGEMWDDDRCNFFDVTVGVARLQELLAIFNDAHGISPFCGARRILR